MICPSYGQDRESDRFCDGCGGILVTAEAVTPTLQDDFLPSTSFVGRREELGELKSHMEDALAGQGRLVMLVGEPGIGKTRTARELANYRILGVMGEGIHRRVVGRYVRHGVHASLHHHQPECPYHSRSDPQPGASSSQRIRCSGRTAAYFHI